MKRFTIVLAAITFMMSIQVQAQATKEEMNRMTNLKKASSLESSVLSSATSKLYGEIRVFEVNRETTVKVYFDEIIRKIVKDNNEMILFTNMEKFKYLSLGQCLNVLSSHGWMVDNVWTTLEITGTVQHFLVSYEVGKLTPVSPWSEKSTKGKVLGGRN